MDRIMSHWQKCRRFVGTAARGALGSAAGSYLGGPYEGALGQAAGGVIGEYVGDQAQRQLFSSNETPNQANADQVDGGTDEGIGGGGSHIGTSVNASSVLIDNVPAHVENHEFVFDITGSINIKNQSSAN